MICCPLLMAWLALGTDTSIHASAGPAAQASLAVSSSAPAEGDADVRLDTVVRVEFSHDVDPSTLRGRVRVRYSAADSVERGEAQPPRVSFKTNYFATERVLVIRPDRPLERFRRVTVELLEGITGTQGSPLTPWTLSFVTGGS